MPSAVAASAASISAASGGSGWRSTAARMGVAMQTASSKWNRRWSVEHPQDNPSAQLYAPPRA